MVDSYEEWEQLQLILDNSKLEEKQGDYYDKTQKGFALEGTGERVFLWNAFNEGLYGVRFIECSSN